MYDQYNFTFKLQPYWSLILFLAWRGTGQRWKLQNRDYCQQLHRKPEIKFKKLITLRYITWTVHIIWSIHHIRYVTYDMPHLKHVTWDMCRYLTWYLNSNLEMDQHRNHMISIILYCDKKFTKISKPWKIFDSNHKIV